MTNPLTLADLTVGDDGHGVRTIWDNRNPDRPVPVNDADLVELIDRLIHWMNVIGEEL